MWGGLPGGHICSKTGSNWMKDHGATKVGKSRFLSSCQYTQKSLYTHGVAHRLLGPHYTLSCVLINQIRSTNIFHLGDSPASVHGNCWNALRVYLYVGLHRFYFLPMLQMPSTQRGSICKNKYLKVATS